MYVYIRNYLCKFIDTSHICTFVLQMYVCIIYYSMYIYAYALYYVNDKIPDIIYTSIWFWHHMAFCKRISQSLEF